MNTQTNVATKASRALERAETRAERSRLSQGVPSKPLLGLPLKRLIPQDVHTVGDHLSAATNVVAAYCAETPVARAAALGIAGTATSVSLMTDYRLSLVKVVPIEVHEAIDYVTAASNILSPFVLGYFRKSPLTSALQIASGVTVLLTSLFTDYRGYKGITWGRGRRPPRLA